MMTECRFYICYIIVVAFALYIFHSKKDIEYFASVHKAFTHFPAVFSVSTYHSLSHFLFLPYSASHCHTSKCESVCFWPCVFEYNCKWIQVMSASGQKIDFVKLTK